MSTTTATTLDQVGKLYVDDKSTYLLKMATIILLEKYNFFINHWFGQDWGFLHQRI